MGAEYYAHFGIKAKMVESEELKTCATTRAGSKS